MAKEVKNSITEADINKLSIIRDEVIFSPSPAQRRAKAKYYTRADGLLSANIEETAMGVSRFVDEPAIVKWWGQPGFREWFFNSEETKERLEYLFMLALDTAEFVLLDPDANASAKVQMIKVLAGLSGKDKEVGEKVLDERIQKMNAEQLREFIKAQVPKVLEDKQTDTDNGE